MTSFRGGSKRTGIAHYGQSPPAPSLRGPPSVAKPGILPVLPRQIAMRSIAAALSLDLGLLPSPGFAGSTLCFESQSAFLPIGRFLSWAFHFAAHGESKHSANFFQIIGPSRGRKPKAPSPEGGSYDLEKIWCPGQESNLHTVTYTALNRARLPIPPPGQSMGMSREFFTFTWHWQGEIRGCRAAIGLRARSVLPYHRGMQSKWFFGLALASFFASPAAQAAVSQKCSSKVFAGQAVNWCYRWDASASSKQVVYYFHGIGASEKAWKESALSAALEKEAKKLSQPVPHVFAISFGPAWFLSDVPKGSSSRLDLLFQEVIPALEKNIKAKPERRFLIGESMGGYNALRASMTNPSFFAKVVALCPALLPIGPYCSPEEEEKFIERNPEMDANMVRGLRAWATQEFPTAEDWTRNNPLDHAEDGTLPPALLSYYAQDEYGFREGTMVFADKLKKSGKVFTLRSLEGSHCAHTPELRQEVANFLLTP